MKRVKIKRTFFDGKLYNKNEEIDLPDYVANIHILAGRAEAMPLTSDKESAGALVIPEKKKAVNPEAPTDDRNSPGILTKIKNKISGGKSQSKKKGKKNA